jgi:hypothetical protein
MSDLPTLPKYCHPTGKSFLCWNWVLGRCFRGPRCRFARGHLKRANPMKRLPTASPTSSAKGYYISLTSRSARAVTAPPRTNAKGGELAPLQIPDYGWDRVLSDAKRRQSTKDSYLTQLVVHVVANSRSLSGRIGRLGWSEKRNARLQDAWHSGHHCRTMNSNRGRGHQIPRSSTMARRATTRFSVSHRPYTTTRRDDRRRVA